MRIHRITVQDVRGVHERTLDFPDSGVVVVEGPNEVGKSTMLEAFDKLLDPRLKSTSVREEVRQLAPVGRDVGPYVEAEFTVGGHRLRFAKRWLRQPLTTLEVMSPAPEQLSGEAAQARVDQLISASLDRTLWDALRFTQSQDGTVAPLVDSAALSSALDAAAGSALHVEDGERILDRVAAEYALYFTRTGRPTGAYKAAMASYTQHQDSVSEAHRRLQEAEQLLQRQEQSLLAVANAEETAQAARAELTDAVAAQESVAQIVTAHEQARARLGEASEKSRAAVRVRQQRRELVIDLSVAAERVASAQAQLLADREASEAVGEALVRAEEEAAAADETAERAEQVWEQAQEQAELRAGVANLAALESLVDTVQSLVRRLQSARRSLPTTTVTTQGLADVKELHHRVSLLQARHEVASGRVRVESLGGGVEVAPDGAAPEGTARVEPHQQRTFVVTEEVVVTAGGVVRVVVIPEQGGQERAAELGAARLTLQHALEQHGVQTVEELEEVVQEQERARQEVRDLSRELEITLSSRPGEERAQAIAGAVPHTLTQEVAALRARLGDAASAPATQRLPEDAPEGLPEDAPEGLPEDAPEVLPRDAASTLPQQDAASAAAQARTAMRAVQEARVARRGTAAAVKECRARVQQVHTVLERAAGRLESDRARVAELTLALARAREQVPDEALETQVRERSTRLAAVELEAEQAARALEEADVEGIDRRCLAAATQVELADAELSRLTAALHALNGQIEMAASEGRREVYDHAVADLDEAERHLTSLDRRARAARHLWRTLQSHRDAAHRAYVLPYTRALEGLGRTVYGSGFGVTVDDQLTLAARTLDGTTVPFEQLSGGAKEQLGILARLAVARLVDPAQGVPVVIDDALGYSDPVRLQQMAQVLGASAQGADVQVILLTCTPDRYAAIPAAATLRLTA